MKTRPLINHFSMTIIAIENLQTMQTTQTTQTRQQ